MQALCITLLISTELIFCFVSNIEKTYLITHRFSPIKKEERKFGRLIKDKSFLNDNNFVRELTITTTQIHFQLRMNVYIRCYILNEAKRLFGLKITQIPGKANIK